VSLEYRTGELLKARFIAHVAEIAQISHRSLVRDVFVGFVWGMIVFMVPLLKNVPSIPLV
jgi:hypothetical protein